MKVSELIERLEQLPPDADVKVSRDEEGNGFSDLWDVAFSYTDDEGYPIHPDDEADYDLENEARSVILWP